MTASHYDRYCKPQFGFPISDWHQSFAWRPRRTFDGRLVWLRSLMRRRYHRHDYLRGGPDQWWIYATVQP